MEKPQVGTTYTVTYKPRPRGKAVTKVLTVTDALTDYNGMTHYICRGVRGAKEYFTPAQLITLERI